MEKRKLLFHPLFLLATAVLSGLSLGYASAYADVKTEVEEEAKTVNGVLQVLRETEDGRRFKYVVMLQGKVLVEKDSQIKSIKSVYPNKTAARLILLEIITGGSGCPAHYRVVEIKADGGANVTNEFGICSDLAKTAYENGAWRIDLPRFGGASAASWFYRDGKLTKVERRSTGSAPTKSK